MQDTSKEFRTDACRDGLAWEVIGICHLIFHRRHFQFGEIVSPTC